MTDMTADRARHEDVRAWRSPVSHYAAARLGRAEVAKSRRATRAHWWAEGVRGLVSYRYADACDVTVLKIGGRVWMTDEPPYVWSLESFARRSKERVLVAGLGLGIVAHQLCGNPAVEEIQIVDREPDVAALVGPLLPRDPRLNVHIGDFDAFMGDASRRDWLPDTVIWDLAVWSRRDRAGRQAEDMLAVPLRVAEAFGPYKRDGERWAERPGWNRGGIEVFVHGLDRDPEGADFVRTEEFRRAREAMFGRPAPREGRS